MKLTENFSLSEATGWHNHHPSITGTTKVNLQNWINEALTTSVKSNIQLIANELQELRNEVNAHFPEYNGRIGLRPLSWFRPVKWEKLRKRSGYSRHTFGDAVDFIAVNVKPEDYEKVMNWLWARLNRGTGFKGGLARSMSGKRYVFIHIDLGRKRRWTY